MNTEQKQLEIKFPNWAVQLEIEFPKSLCDLLQVYVLDFGRRLGELTVDYWKDSRPTMIFH
jgi:hypothetical protein